jgi:hypothetical protein
MSKRSRKRRRRERERESQQSEVVCVERNDWRALYRVVGSSGSTIRVDQKQKQTPKQTPLPKDSKPYHPLASYTASTYSNYTSSRFAALLASLKTEWSTAVAAPMSDTCATAPKSDAPNPETPGPASEVGVWDLVCSYLGGRVK